VVSGRGRQSALPIRRRSTCLRATSSGSAAPSVTDSCSDLCAARHTWPVRSGTCSPRRPGAMAAIPDPTAPPSRLFRPGGISRSLPGHPQALQSAQVFPARFPGALRPSSSLSGLSLAGSSRAVARRSGLAAGAGSHTRFRRGIPRGAAGGRTSRSCVHRLVPGRVRPRSPCASGAAAQPHARPR